MRVLYFDCFSGISGDMTVGALRDLGVEEAVFQDALKALGLGGEFHAHFHRGSRQNIAGWKFDVHAHEHGHAHHEAHHHHGHEHHGHHAHGRSFREICELIEKSTLSDFIKTRTVAVFHRIAVAEGKIHGLPPEEITFHEVGAVDSIADIVAACAGLEALGVERVFSSRLVEGTGWVDCAHGRFPLPAPATLEILTGVPLRQIEESSELITPTGAALLAEFADSYGPLPEIRIEKIGYGLGTRDSAPRPNVLRAVLGEIAQTSDAETDEITQIETNLDDFTPELAGATMERLFAAGALDVFFTPAQMKKNRPGFVLTVLASEENAAELARIILSETSAFGVRMHRVRRMKLRREFRDVETPYGPVRIKLGFLGDELVQAAPEYESCREAAAKAGVSVRDVHLAAWIGTTPKPEA
ncbi:MAG: nickel pincer cofactor biosynthesis protein LarC [Terrimicrobiaceae bacterium]